MMSHSTAVCHKPTVAFGDVELLKNRPLGHGAYGTVCHAKHDTRRRPCAAKILHQALSRGDVMERFEKEIELLSMMRHPNIVLYLGVSRDPQSGSPVLLMELMDRTLTNFLETEATPLTYDTQFNICHNVIQALVYLHDNTIYHRDLSGNNILLKDNEAKVSDFGMARLIDPHRSTLTTCPGTRVYMPPEALKEKPQYTEKIDCFSFGVVIIQTLTRLYPNPGERCTVKIINDPDIPGGTAEIPIKEVNRRQDHISMINPPHHPLLLIALKCLEDKPDDRPSAQVLREMIRSVKDFDGNSHGIAVPVPPPTTCTNQQHNLDGCKSNNPSISSDLLSDYEVIQGPLQQPEGSREQTVTPDSQKSLSGASKSSTTDLRLTWKSSRIDAPCGMFRYSDAVFHEGTAYILPANSRKVYAYNTCIRAAHGRWSHFASCQYLGSSLSVINHHLTTIGGKRTCSGTGYRYKVNTTGGYESTYTDKLCSLTEKKDGSKEWAEKFPAMPTKRAFTTALNTGTTLIIAGGVGGDILRTVEILNIETRQWLIAQDLPQPMWAASATLCGENMYILGGQEDSDLSTVYTCSLESLLQPENCRSPSWTSRVAKWIKSPAIRPVNVWIKLPDIPVTQATCVSVCGCVVAVGGKNSDSKATASVHMYDKTTSKWIPIGHRMPAAQCSCFVFNHTDNTMVVVGGNTSSDRSRVTLSNRMYIALAV